MGDLLVLLTIGDERYALEASRVIEVLPLVQLSALPGAPAGVAGLALYRGAPLPVVDVVQAAKGHPARRQLGSRILVVAIRAGAGSARVGLLVDGVLGTRLVKAEHRRPTGMALPDAPWLEAVVPDGAAALKLVNPEHLLTEAQRAALEIPP